MRQLARQGSVDPLVRSAAASIIRTAGPRDPASQIRRVRLFLKERVQYVADPVDVELVNRPRAMLQQVKAKGRAFGDCDDVATLAAALGLAIGLPARFVAVGFDGLAGPFGHVYTELTGPGLKQWMRLDTTRPEVNARQGSRVWRVMV